jgi:hypothetical protein
VPFTVNPTFGLKFRGARTDNKINVVDVNGSAPVIGNAMIGAEGKWGRAYQAAPATTNLVQNPSFEVDTAGYYEYNTANLLSAGANGARDTKYAVYGGASLKYVTPNLAANEGWHCDLIDAVTASTSYTVSIYVYGSGALTLALINRSGGNVQFANTAITATKQWTRYSITATTPVGCTSVRIALYQPTQAAATFWADALQLEQKAYLTPFCDGSLGTGHTWAGTAHAASSSRTGIPTLSYANAYRFIPEATGTISCWFYPVAEKTGNTYMTLFRYSTSQHVIARIVNSGDVMQCYWGATARNSSNAVIWNTWNHLALTVTEGNLNIYLNGVKTSSTTGTALAHGTGAFTLNYNVATEDFNGWLDELFILDYVLTDAEVAQLYASNQPANFHNPNSDFRLANNTDSDGAVWGNYDGLFGQDAAGNEAFALVSGAKDWGTRYTAASAGQLAAGDLVLGDPDAFHLMYDASAASLLIGKATEENITLSGTALRLNYGSTAYVDLTAGALTIGETGASKNNVYIATAPAAAPAPNTAAHPTETP